MKKLKKSKQNKPGRLYVIRIIGTDICKIGISQSDIMRRLRNIASGLPYPIEILLMSDIKDNIVGIEQLLHAKFNIKRINGEWFALTIDDINSINEVAINRYDAPINMQFGIPNFEVKICPICNEKELTPAQTYCGSTCRSRAKRAGISPSRSEYLSATKKSQKDGD